MSQTATTPVVELRHFSKWYGDVVAVHASSHRPPLEGRYWNLTVATPDPESVAAPLNAFVPEMNPLGAGSVMVTPVGAVLSIRRLVTGVEVVELPALSVATTRKS